MRRILLGLLTIGLISVSVAGATRALFSDTERVLGNTFTAGSLDLKVNDQDEPIEFQFSAEGMVPGQEAHAGCVTLTNAGSIPGRLSLKVLNPISHENELLEPEQSDGDQPGQEIDPTGYDANDGDGELWDQITFQFCLDNGTGSYGGNGACDTGVGETIF